MLSIAYDVEINYWCHYCKLASSLFVCVGVHVSMLVWRLEVNLEVVLRCHSSLRTGSHISYRARLVGQKVPEILSLPPSREVMVMRHHTHEDQAWVLMLAYRVLSCWSHLLGL